MRLVVDGAMLGLIDSGVCGTLEDRVETEAANLRSDSTSLLSEMGELLMPMD